MSLCPPLSGVILSGAVLSGGEKDLSLDTDLGKVPRPAGENTGLRDDVNFHPQYELSVMRNFVVLGPRSGLSAPRQRADRIRW
jgi:hypothetical protein